MLPIKPGNLIVRADATGPQLEGCINEYTHTEGIFSSKFCGSTLPAPLPKATWWKNVSANSKSVWVLPGDGLIYSIVFGGSESIDGSFSRCLLPSPPAQTLLQPPSEATCHGHLVPNPKSHPFQSMSQAKGREWTEDSRLPSEPACVPYYILSLSRKGDHSVFFQRGSPISQTEIQNTRFKVNVR